MDVGASFWAAQHGYGLTLSRVPVAVQGQIAKALFAQQQFYIIAMALCKVSAILFLIRLSTSKSHTRPGFALAGMAVVWGVASAFTVGLRGRLDSPWATMDGSWDMVSFVETKHHTLTLTSSSIFDGLSSRSLALSSRH